jgi:hypothetical protein
MTEIPPFMSAMPGPCSAPSGRVDGLEAGGLGIDGVVVAGQHDLDRRLGPHDHGDGRGVVLFADAAVGADLGRGQRNLGRRGRQRRKASSKTCRWRSRPARCRLPEFIAHQATARSMISPPSAAIASRQRDPGR